MQEIQVGPQKTLYKEDGEEKVTNDNDHGDDSMLRLWKGTPLPLEKNGTNTKNGIRNNGNRAGLNWLRWSKRTIVPC